MHKLKLRFEGNHITAWVDGNPIIEDYPCNIETGAPYTCGMCGFASGYHYAYFDDFHISNLENSSLASTSFVTNVDLNHYEAVNSFGNLITPGEHVKLGMKIHVKQNITVTDLGRYRINRNKESHALSVYDAGTLEFKASTIVHMSDQNHPKNVTYSAIEMDYFHGFLYAPLQLQLAPGYYLIVSDETIGGDKWYGGDHYLPIIATADPNVIELAGADGRGCVAQCFGDPNLPSSWMASFEEMKSGNCYGPVNFKYMIGT